MLKFEIILVIFLFSVSCTLAVKEYPDCTTKLEWYPHQLNCSLYYLCHHRNAVLRSCAPGLFFNNANGQCMLPEVANCVLSCPAKDDPKKPIFLQDYTDCSKFSLCYNGEAIPWRCASGLFWDVENEWCNFEVDCGHRVNNGNNTDDTPSQPPPPPPEIDLPTTTQEPTTTEEPSVTDQVPPITTVNPDNMDCPLVAGPLFFPHTIYCRKYFKCVQGIAYLLECEGEKEFDFIHGYCTENAICLSRDGTTVAA